MAFFDGKGLEWLQTAATMVGTAVVGAVAWALTTRRRVAKDNSDITREKVETTVQTTLMATLQAERNAAVERLQAEHNAAIERLQKQVDDREMQFGACTERIRSLSEQNLDLRLFNGLLQQELAKHDPGTAARLLKEHWRPVPAGKGDEPP